jgi:hypothetical protein
MRFFYLLLLIVSIVGVLNVSVITGQDRENGSFQKPMVQASSYTINGDRKGQVTVQNPVSGQIIRTFQMREEVVREVFLLDSGKIVAASQKDHAVFWDMDTGQEIHRFPERIYGFSHDQKRFFTYSPQQEISLYSYPDMRLACKLPKGFIAGPEKFMFSPDDRFLGILFATGRPESDEYYPGTGSLRRSIVYSKLFDIKKCQEILEFSKLKVIQLGEFSSDSNFYNLNNSLVFIENEGRYVEGEWRFNLTKNKIEKLSSTDK